jgi:hypothetical protein
MIPASVPKGSDAGGRAHFLGRLGGAFDAKVVPEAEVHGRQDADPAVGQFMPFEQRACCMIPPPRMPRGGQEQDQDRAQGDGVMTRLKVSVASTPR